jgi:phospho-N-acetylmuramoyl-pentapeptide-transferase
VGDEHLTLVPCLGWVNISWLWWPLAILTIVGGSNGVNLTDGLDGLAGGCVAMSLAALAVVTLLVDPLDSAFLPIALGGSAPTGASLLVVIGAALGAILAFLHFNIHPARLFLGDSGSLPLGALLGVVAVAARCELILLLLGAVFVAETLSVVAQVAAFKVLRRRVLRCAPLHHHFELVGWSEQRIVSRFWTAAVAVGLVAVMVTSASVRGDRSARNEGPSPAIADLELFALPATREVLQEPTTSPWGFVSIAHRGRSTCIRGALDPVSGKLILERSR